MELARPTDNISYSRLKLQALYDKDSRPWVVAYSGGKDSTVVLQLVYELLIEVAKKGGVLKPVYVVSSDTRVEAPVVSRYVKETLGRIQDAATSAGLPLQTSLVTPEAAESFWGKMIGLGYPPPTRWFRWCTTYMKIKPSRRAIDEITNQFGSVILMLGSRTDESAARAQSIASRVTTEEGLNPHHEIPNALTFKPIVDWTTDEVWDYLYSTPPPWGGNHDFMLSLYRKANGGECPIVLDLNTPSCGGSRFGCWTCTVVKEDKSMQGFIDSGDASLQPLKNFRDWLKDIREDPSRRSPLRRDGRSAGPGPFNPTTRKELLERLLKMESEIGFELIDDGDLRYIQQQWRKEFDYNDNALEIAKRHGRSIDMANESLYSSEVDGLLEQCAVDADFPPELAHELITTVRARYAELGRWGAKQQLEDALSDLIVKDVRQAEKADTTNDL